MVYLVEPVDQLDHLSVNQQKKITAILLLIKSAQVKYTAFSELPNSKRLLRSLCQRASRSSQTSKSADRTRSRACSTTFNTLTASIWSQSVDFVRISGESSMLARLIRQIAFRWNDSSSASTSVCPKLGQLLELRRWASSLSLLVEPRRLNRKNFNW